MNKEQKALELVRRVLWKKEQVFVSQLLGSLSGCHLYDLCLIKAYIIYLGNVCRAGQKNS